MTDLIGSILDLFAKSPFRPLNEHAEKVKLTVYKMDEAFKAYVEGDATRVEALYNEISALEHAADHVKHTIRENMPATILMPVDRTDLLTFLKQQDDVANSAEIVAQMLTMKMVALPPAVKEDLLRLEKEVVITVDEHVDAVSKIVALLDSSFSSKRVKEVMTIIRKVDTQKHNVEVIKLQAMKTIYGHEKELGAVGVYHLMELVEELVWCAAHAESSTDRLRIITARR